MACKTRTHVEMDLEQRKNKSHLISLWKTSGFSLVELLVVIAIIAVLSSLMLTGFNEAKQRALSVKCKSNLHQLTLAWEMYTSDNDDELPPNNFVFFWPGLTTTGDLNSWCRGNAQTEVGTDSIKTGLLWDYNRTLGIYRCPSDKARVKAASGQLIPDSRRNRSYNMSGSINCDVTKTDIPDYRKKSQISRPQPSQFFVFIDTDEDAIQGSHFMVFPDGFLPRPTWGDLPSDRHSRGANLSFADGSVRYWKWNSPKKWKQFGQTAIQNDAVDLRRLQRSVKPLSNL